MSDKCRMDPTCYWRGHYDTLFEANMEQIARAQSAEARAERAEAECARLRAEGERCWLVAGEVGGLTGVLCSSRERAEKVAAKAGGPVVPVRVVREEPKP